MNNEALLSRLSIVIIKCLLTLLTCLLLVLGWHPYFSPFLLLIAFIPIFLFQEINKNTSLILFLLLSYCNLVIWTFFTTIWIFNINLTAGIVVSLFNPIFFCIPFLFYFIIKRLFGYLIAGIIFVLFWIAIEYLHHNWELAFPYLTLGYPFAKYPWLIQWYEFSGVLGGTLWTLVINMSLVGIIRAILLSKPLAVRINIFFLTIIPPIFSIILFFNNEKRGHKVNFHILHSNADCYSMKYKSNPQDLLKYYLNYTLSNVTNDTDYIIWPETAITERLFYNRIGSNDIITWLKDTLNNYTSANLITGAFVNEVVDFNPLVNDISEYPYIKFNKYKNLFYHSYNAAIQISNKNDNFPIHTKRRLVPIEETIPYPKIMFFTKKYIKSLGGFGFTYKNNNNTIFSSASEKINIAPLICYESLFGEDTADKVLNGANIIVVMLNEGWYKNHVAATHFLNFSRVRAIENRRSIARSSNDGISCLINIKGIIIKKIDEFNPVSFSGILETNERITFFSRHGNFIGKISLYLSLIILPSLLLLRKYCFNNIPYEKYQ